MIPRSNSRFLAFVLLPFVVAFAFPLRVHAQIDQQNKSEKAAAKQKELAKNTLKLLDELIASAYALKLGENRSYILVNAADLLWPYDEKRARSLFWEALSSLNLPLYGQAEWPAAGTNNAVQPGRANVPTKAQMEEMNRYYASINTRREFLQKVARRDPELALDMMRSTRQGPPPRLPGNAQFDPDVSLEQELTFAAAANDPKRALQIAHESLAKGLTYQFLNLLRDVNQKDQEAGTRLAGDIITKLETENPGAQTVAPQIAIGLLRLSRKNGAVLVATLDLQSSSPAVTRLKLDDNQKQDLVYLLTDAALNPSGTGNVLQSIQFVMPEIQQYAPDRMAKLKARLMEYNRTLSPSQREWRDFDARFEKATPDEMLHAANSVSEDQRGALFYQAASKAIARDEADKYRDLINSQIKDEAQRKVALEALDNEQVDFDLNQGKTDELEKLLPLIRVKEQRATAMAEFAILLEKKQEHYEAVKLLDEARALVKVDLVNANQSNALLAVMLGYALVDPPKAFTMIEPVVDQANDEMSNLVLLDKVAKTGAIKDGEIILNQRYVPLEYSMIKYAAGIVALAKADFPRTKGLADRLQRNELKVAARLMLVQALLRDAEARAS